MPVLEQTMTSWDGAQLFYRAWIPEQPTEKALLLFHRATNTPVAGPSSSKCWD